MRTFLIIYLLGLFSILSFAQQFQLEATVDRNIRAILDIDGDGIMEYIADTNKVYDGLTHNLKYILPIGYYLYFGDKIEANNPYSVFPHIDFNFDGKRDLILGFYTSQSNPDDKLAVFDVVNNIVLFEFDQPEGYVQLIDCIDIDGDNELELVIGTRTGTYPNEIYKTYIYSTGVTTSVLEGNSINTPMGYRLEQNFPNPFNPSTKIEYSISEPSFVRINIYNINGELIKEVINEEKNNGNYSVTWNGKNDTGVLVTSGTYFYQIQVGDFVQAKKMILLK